MKKQGYTSMKSNSTEPWIPVATLLDITKAYLRVNRPSIWNMLRKYGIIDECIRILRGVHEETEYSVRKQTTVSSYLHNYINTYSNLLECNGKHTFKLCCHLYCGCE